MQSLHDDVFLLLVIHIVQINHIVNNKTFVKQQENLKPETNSLFE